jgi:Holliday junction resolvasome RuvABC endonuclease subunit
VKTALRLAEVRGVVLLAAAQHGVEVHSYAPRLVKASVAGYGHADKRQLQLMVQSVLGLAEVPEPADAADALAVALCHLQSEQFRQRFAIPRSARTGRAALSVAAVPRPTPSVRSSPARQAAPSQ